VTKPQLIAAIQLLDVKHFIQVADLNAMSLGDLQILFNAMSAYPHPSEL